MRAAATGNSEYITSCLSSAKTITVNAKDRFGQTAAHWSSYRGQIHVLKILIQAGASMETKDMDGRVTLHWAVRKERAACVHYLLQCGSPMDHQTKGTGETALHKASRQGNLDICRLLCIAGCNRDICTSHNQTALDIAIEMRTLEIEYAKKEQTDQLEAKNNWEQDPVEEEKEKEKEKEKNAGTGSDTKEKETGGEPHLTEVQKSKQQSYPTDRPKESPYVANGAEVEDDNKFGPIVEFLQQFTEEMVNPESLRDAEDEEAATAAGATKKRKRGKFKRKSTIYNDDAPMAEVFEEQLRSGSMQSGGSASTINRVGMGGCMIQ